MLEAAIVLEAALGKYEAPETRLDISFPPTTRRMLGSSYPELSLIRSKDLK
jgi:hypothetical protein